MTTLPDELRTDVETLWDYHHLHHEPRPTDVGIGLGSHDLGVATYAAERCATANMTLSSRARRRDPCRASNNIVSAIEA